MIHYAAVWYKKPQRDNARGPFIYVLRDGEKFVTDPSAISDCYFVSEEYSRGYMMMLLFDWRYLEFRRFVDGGEKIGILALYDKTLVFTGDDILYNQVMRAFRFSNIKELREFLFEEDSSS